MNAASEGEGEGGRNSRAERDTASPTYLYFFKLKFDGGDILSKTYQPGCFFQSQTYSNWLVMNSSIKVVLVYLPFSTFNWYNGERILYRRGLKC